MRDPHGRSDYKKLNPNECDILFCPWDIVDIPERFYKDQINNSIHLPYSKAEQKNNNEKVVETLNGILELKYKLWWKMILLLGNHDSQYIREIASFEWYNEEIAHELSLIFKNNLNQFDFIHNLENEIIFSHGWITKPFAEYYKNKTNKAITDMKHINPSNTKAIIWDKDKKRLNTNNILLQRDDSADNLSGPLRTDYNTLIQNPLDSITQIFWHHNIINTEISKRESNWWDLLCIDTPLEKNAIQYLEI